MTNNICGCRLDDFHVCGYESFLKNRLNVNSFIWLSLVSGSVRPYWGKDVSDYSMLTRRE